MVHSTSLTKLALQKFQKNFWGVFSLSFLVLCVLVALFAYALAPDDSQNANQMHLSIHSKAPGFTVQMLTLPSEEITQNSLSAFFFGRKNTLTEIPISGYTLKENAIEITAYIPEGEAGFSKEYGLNYFPSISQISEVPQQYISEKTFLLGTDGF